MESNHPSRRQRFYRPPRYPYPYGISTHISERAASNALLGMPVYSVSPTENFHLWHYCFPLTLLSDVPVRLWHKRTSREFIYFKFLAIFLIRNSYNIPFQIPILLAYIWFELRV